MAQLYRKSLLFYLDYRMVFQQEENNNAEPTTRTHQAVLDGRGIDLQQQ